MSVFSVIFVIEVCFVTPYRHAVRIERKLNELTNAEERDREIRVWECVDTTVGILKTNLLVIPFHTVSSANAYRLASNGELLEVCERIEVCGHEHPLRGNSPRLAEGRRTVQLDVLKKLGE